MKTLIVRRFPPPMFPFLLMAAFLFSQTVPAAAFPHAPKLAAGALGTLAGGFQLLSGEEARFELFAADPGSPAIRRLGHYNGTLAGVAVADDGRVLALTENGSLGVYGDDADIVARPDSRWHMQALTWWDGAPLAVTLDNGRLFTVRPDTGGGWLQDARPIIHAEGIRSVVLVPLGDILHLLWNTQADDLSGGALRHMTLQGGLWQEQPPLPLGDTISFTAFRLDGDLAVGTLVPDLLNPESIRPVFQIRRNGRWLNDNFPPEVVSHLSRAHALAATEQDAAVWLVAGSEGASLISSSPSGSAVLIAAAPPADSGGFFGIRIVTLAAIAFFLIFYCRRSRMLSRLLPARPPDFLSRAAALGVDWFLVSFGMGFYHIANGDARILVDLLARGDIEGIFWANLIGLIIFMAIMEGAYGWTPGKRLAGLRIRSVAGGPPGMFQAVFRNILRVVDMFPLPIGFPGISGAIVTLLNPRRQRVGDILAGTMVRRHLPLKERKFLLASASPRRLELLRALGLNIRAQSSAIDESAVVGETPEQTVRLLAQAKAHAAATRLEDREVVVAADTVVVLDGEVLGKPRDSRDAAAMLRRLSGRAHTVLTGVTVWDVATGQDLSVVEETEVEFRQLSEREIDAYVATGDPLDKAGAYGVQTGYLVKQVRGSLSNVAGLPMEKLQGMLALLDS